MLARIYLNVDFVDTDLDVFSVGVDVGRKLELGQIQVLQDGRHLFDWGRAQRDVRLELERTLGPSYILDAVLVAL